jgi:DNA (cytosine-5)-methyltransferase 1
MNVLDLFSGIGGFSLGFERAGMKTIAFCECEKHAKLILKKHWPDVPIFDDVSKLDGKQYRGTVDIVCGGFPCQDLSQAGAQAGFDGERSILYREMLRIISECLPRYAIFENVTGLLTGESGRWFAQFLYDLAAIGYDAEWHCIPASEIGANHHRDRVWIIAYHNIGCEREKEEIQSRRNATINGADAVTNTQELHDGAGNREPIKRQKQQLGKGTGKIKIPANANGQRCERFAKIAHHLKQQIELMRSVETERRRSDISEPALLGTNDGVPRRLDRIRRLGNAVVPQIPEAIGKAIIEYEKQVSA